MQPDWSSPRFFALLCTPRAQNKPDQPSEKTWTEIKDNIFNGVTLEDGTGIVSLETPLRAEDAHCAGLRKANAARR